MRTLIYDRVSSDKAQGRSVAEQEQDNRRVIERNGWELVEVITDNDRGASRYSKKTREGWERVVSLLEGGQIDCLVTWEASRSTRDLAAYVKLREVCRRTGVKLCYNGKVHDLSRGDDSFSTGLDILLAEREVDQTRDRVMRSMRANATKGRPHGKLLYGYARRYDGVGNLVEQFPREDQASAIREAAKRVAAGEACNAIAKDFNLRGIPAPRQQQWILTTVRRVLINPAYIGKRVHKGKIIGDALWAPILDEATYYTCLRILTDPKRRTTREGAVKHLLTGIATCGVCGTPVKVQKNRGFWAYLCPAGFCVSRKKVYVDDLIEELLIGRLSMPDAKEAFVIEDGPMQDHIGELEVLRGRLDEFYESASRGEITPIALARIESSLLPKVKAAEERISAASSFPLIGELISGDTAEVWGGLTIPQKRAVVSRFLDIRILKAHQGARTFDPETVSVRWKTLSAEN